MPAQQVFVVRAIRAEAVALLDAIRTYNVAHEGDSDDAEIDAAFEMEDAAVKLVRRLATCDRTLAGALAKFESGTVAGGPS